MKNILAILLLFFGCIACDTGSTNDQSPLPGIDVETTEPQATLMYFTGTSLNTYHHFFDSNIEAAKAAIKKGGLGNGRFFYFLPSSSTSGRLVELSRKDNSAVATVVKEYNGIRSLSVEALDEVISDFKSQAVDCSYNLVISGHGTGWIPKSYKELESKSARSNAAALHNYMWKQDYTTPEIITRFMGGESDGYLDISELKEGIEKSDTNFGYIIFDECFMSSIEVLYELKDQADYIVASPCEIMGNGFPYDKVIPYLFTKNGYSFDLNKVCKSYYDYYQNISSICSGCVAYVVTSELDALAYKFKEINQFGINSVATDNLQQYERLTTPVFLDLQQYVELASKSEKLTKEFQAQFDKAFPPTGRYHTDRFFANIGPTVSSVNNYDAYYTTIEYYSGVTTSEPSQSIYQDDWEMTSWAQATR